MPAAKLGWDGYLAEPYLKRKLQSIAEGLSAETESDAMFHARVTWNELGPNEGDFALGPSWLWEDIRCAGVPGPITVEHFDTEKNTTF